MRSGALTFTGGPELDRPEPRLSSCGAPVHHTQRTMLKHDPEERGSCSLQLFLGESSPQSPPASSLLRKKLEGIWNYLQSIYDIYGEATLSDFLVNRPADSGPSRVTTCWWF